VGRLARGLVPLSDKGFDKELSEDIGLALSLEDVASKVFRKENFFVAFAKNCIALNMLSPKAEATALKAGINNLLDLLCHSCSEPRTHWIRYCSLAFSFIGMIERSDAEPEKIVEKMIDSTLEFKGSFDAISLFFETDYIIHPSLFYYMLALVYLLEVHIKDSVHKLHLISNYLEQLIILYRKVNSLGVIYGAEG
jgi:hypothetical protein